MQKQYVWEYRDEWIRMQKRSSLNTHYQKHNYLRLYFTIFPGKEFMWSASATAWYPLLYTFLTSVLDEVADDTFLYTGIQKYPTKITPKITYVRCTSCELALWRKQC
jgi:hypothetical protein